MLRRSLTLNSQSELRSFLADAFEDAGYTLALDNSDFLAYKKRNALMTTDADGFLNAVIIADGTNIGITTAAELPSINLIPKVTAPKTSAFTTNYRATVVITDFHVVLSLKHKGTGNIETFVLATVDYRELNTQTLAGNPSLFVNYRNNGQCIFKVGDENNGRALYAGDPGNENQFDEPLLFDTPSFNASPYLGLNNNGTLMLSTIAVGSNGKYLGLLKDMFVTSNTALQYLDKPIDQFGREYIFVPGLVAGIN